MAGTEFTGKELAEIFGVSYQTVSYWKRKGWLGCTWRGNRRYFPFREALRFAMNPPRPIAPSAAKTLIEAGRVGEVPKSILAAYAKESVNEVALTMTQDQDTK